jgi:hypothetical protein
VGWQGHGGVRYVLMRPECADGWRPASAASALAHAHRALLMGIVVMVSRPADGSFERGPRGAELRGVPFFGGAFASATSRQVLRARLWADHGTCFGRRSTRDLSRMVDGRSRFISPLCGPGGAPSKLGAGEVIHDRFVIGSIILCGSLPSIQVVRKHKATTMRSFLAAEESQPKRDAASARAL